MQLAPGNKSPLTEQFLFVVLFVPGRWGRGEKGAVRPASVKLLSILSKALSCDRLPEEIWCSQQILARERSSRFYMKFEHQISEGTCPHIAIRAWDRTTLLFLLYNAKFWAKIAKNGHYALIGDRWGETLSRHAIDFGQWERAKI